MLWCLLVQHVARLVPAVSGTWNHLHLEESLSAAAELLFVVVQADAPGSDGLGLGARCDVHVSLLRDVIAARSRQLNCCSSDLLQSVRRCTLPRAAVPPLYVCMFAFCVFV
jgi:hypothetical protein